MIAWVWGSNALFAVAGPVRALAQAPDGSQVVAGGWDGTVVAFDLAGEIALGAKTR